MEEIDLCWRMKRAGHSIMVQPASVVYHVGGGTLSKSSPFKTYLNFRNGLQLLVKNLPSHELIPTVFLRMILDGVAAFKFLAAGNAKDFWAVLRAHGYFYGNLRRTLGKRSGNYDGITARYNGLIVAEHFIKGKKKFSELPEDKF